MTSGEYWLSHEPTVSELLVDGLTPEKQRQAQEEIALLTGRDGEGMEEASRLLECLAEFERPVFREEAFEPFKKIDILTAYRVFSLFPHPSLPGVRQGEQASELADAAREMYVGAGYWLVAKRLDLTLALRWLEDTYKPFEKYQFLCTARYNTIQALSQYSAIDSSFTTAALWLLYEYRIARSRLLNTEMPTSTNEARRLTSQKIESLNKAVQNSKPPSIESEHPMFFIVELDKIAARLAIDNPYFDKHVFQKLQSASKKWNNGKRGLKLLNPPRRRGRGRGGGQK